MTNARYRRIIVRCFCIVLIALSASLQADDMAPDGLSILLTNDDGFDSLGVKALGDALVAAGHRVTIVAPAGQRSGSGMKITLGRLALVQHSDAVWSVDASPADAVSIALKHVMASDKPDLVVSGANFGQNIGSNVMISGTVGAAMMAVLEGIPAVAISVGLDLSEAKTEPEHFPSTIAAFPAAAKFVTALVDRLMRSRRGALLPPRTMLNINYPAQSGPGSLTARWAPVSRYGGFSLIYPDVADGQIRSWIEVDERGVADSNSDTGLFAAGQITLSVLTPDWNSAADSVRLKQRIGDLAR